MHIQLAQAEPIGKVKLVRSAKPWEMCGFSLCPTAGPSALGLGARCISVLCGAGASAGRHDPPPECLSTREMLSIMENVSDIKKIIYIRNT